MTDLKIQKKMGLKGRLPTTGLTYRGNVSFYND